MARANCQLRGSCPPSLAAPYLPLDAWLCCATSLPQFTPTMFSERWSTFHWSNSPAVYSKATAAWELQTVPSRMLGNNRISVEAKRGLGSANFLYRSQYRTRRRWLTALVIACMVTLVDLAAAASVRHDIDHPELVPVANISQIVRHTAASCLNNCIH